MSVVDKNKVRQWELTQAQQGIWLGQKLSPQPALYNAAELIEIKGDLNIPYFEQALSHVYQQAEALNVIFVEENDVPKQVAFEHKHEIDFIDLSATASPFDNACLWARENLVKSMNLAKEAPTRNAILCLGEAHFIWYQCIHHIVSDGYAFALLSQAVAETYNALLKGKDVSSLSHFGQFDKLVAEDKDYCTSAKFEKNKHFWSEYLKDSVAPVSLAARHAFDSKSPVDSWPRKIHREFPAGLFEELKAKANDEQCVWSDYLYACVASFLAKKTSVNQIVLGMPVMGRMGSASLRVPAMVMNIVPLKVDIPSGASFNDILDNVKNNIALTRPHHKYRYEQLRRDLNLQNSTRPLFSSIVNIMPFDRQLSFGKAESTQHSLSAGPVEDLAFSFVLSGKASLRFLLESHTGDYSVQQSEEIAEDLLVWIGKVVKDPDIKIKTDTSPLSFLKGQHLESEATSVLELFDLQCRQQQNKIAVTDGGEHYSYARLLDDVNCVAQGLYEYLKKENATKTVGLVLSRGYRAIVACLATMRAGAAYVFLDALGPTERNRLICDEIQADIIVTEGQGLQWDVASPVVDIRALFALSSGEENTKKISSAFPKIKAHDLAYMIYTSGSTGKPKGVLISHQAKLDFVEAAIHDYPFGENDCVLQFAPLHFDTFVEEVFGALCAGASLVVRREDDIQSVAYFLRQCAYYGISILDLPTAYWHELVYACKEEGIALPECIDVVIIGGEAASPERVKQWHEINNHGARLLNTYGPSEACVVATFAELKKGDKLSIGRPLSKRFVAIVNEHQHILPRACVGELVIGGAGIADGYLGLTEQSAQKFISLPSLLSSAKAYKTGDKARIDEFGVIHFLGRIDDELKISGQRIQPLEVENALKGIAGVDDAAVCVDDSISDRKRLHAFVISQMAGEDIRTKLGQCLPPSMIPSAFHFLDKLTFNASGKVDRKALLASVEDASLSDSVDLSRCESLITEVWQEVLGIRNISLEDDFFNLGGHSLQAIQAVNRLSARFKKAFSINLLFSYPTLSSLAQFIDQDSSIETDFANKREKIIADSLLCEKEFPPISINIKSMMEPKHVLLTGANGFVGVQLLAELIKKTNSHISCLIRARSETEARKKLELACSQQNIRMKAWSSRVSIALGDLSKTQLGLQSHIWHDLSNSCDLIIHNGARVSVMQDYQSLRACNVESTRELLKLAKPGLIPLHYVSTIATALDPYQSKIEEAFVPWHDGLNDGYQQSKWAAEHLLQQASQRGYPVSVFRLGRVTGDLASAYVNPQDLMWNIIRASFNVKAVPDLDFSEPWTPVDKVAQAIVSMISGDHKMGVTHLLPKKMINTQDMFSWLCAKSPILHKLPMSDLLKTLEQSSDPQDMSLFGFFTQKKQHKSTQLRQEFVCENYEQGFPPISRGDFLKYLDFWQKTLLENKKELSDAS